MNPHTSFPLYLPGISSEKNNQLTLVVGSIGSYKTKMAVYKTQSRRASLELSEVYDNKKYSSFSALYQDFIAKANIKPDRISLGLAGPVINDTCIINHLDWDLNRNEIAHETGVDTVCFINDLEAIAYGLHDVGADQYEIVHAGNKDQVGNVAILAPGNGLGESGLFWDGQFLRPFATEGGHCEFSPRNNKEVNFYQYLNNIYGIVSWENVLSKEGMFNIYRFLRDVEKHEGCKNLNNKCADDDFVDEIILNAVEHNSHICKLTLQHFIQFMAREANSLVLKLKATGGLILTGEIPLKIKSLLENKKFYSNFIVSDKMDHLLKDIPIYILLNEHSVIRGAAYYGAYYEN